METIGRPETAKSLQNPKPQPEAKILTHYALATKTDPKPTALETKPQV